jgi:hypothetical protein
MRAEAADFRLRLWRRTRPGSCYAGGSRPPPAPVFKFALFKPPGPTRPRPGATGRARAPRWPGWVVSLLRRLQGSATCAGCLVGPGLAAAGPKPRRRAIHNCQVQVGRFHNDVTSHCQRDAQVCDALQGLAVMTGPGVTLAGIVTLPVRWRYHSLASLSHLRPMQRARACT